MPTPNIAAGTNIDVPVLPAPQAAPAQVIDVPNTLPAEKINVAEKLGIKTQGPMEALGENPEEDIEQIDRWAGKAARERGPDGKFLPKTKAEAPQPGETPKEAPKTPTAPAKAQEKPAPAKVKIGDEEFTAEEWAAKLKELRDKAEAAAKSPEPAKSEPPVVPKTPEQEKADADAAEKTFIDETAKKYSFDQAEFDRILASGDPKPLAEMFARLEMNARKWFAEQVNPRLSELRESMAPVMQTHEQVQQFKTEQQFLDAHPDIREHPEGLKTQREINAALNEQHDRLQRLKNANIANAAELTMLEQFDKTTPDQWAQDVAHHTRQRLGLGGTKAAPEPTNTPAVAPKPKAPPAEVPFNGDRPGGGGSGKAQMSEEARLAHEITSM